MLVEPTLVSSSMVCFCTVSLLSVHHPYDVAFWSLSPVFSLSQKILVENSRRKQFVSFKSHTFLSRILRFHSISSYPSWDMKNPLMHRIYVTPTILGSQCQCSTDSYFTYEWLECASIVMLQLKILFNLLLLFVCVMVYVVCVNDDAHMPCMCMWGGTPSRRQLSPSTRF